MEAFLEAQLLRWMGAAGRTCRVREVCRVLLNMWLRQDTGARVPECGGERQELSALGAVVVGMASVSTIAMWRGTGDCVWSWKFWEGRGSVVTGFGGNRAWTWKGWELGVLVITLLWVLR